MPIYGDNQTKHFYALKSTDVVTVKDLMDSNLFRVMIANAAGKNIATSDVIDRKLIKRIKANTVKPTYYRNWTIRAMKSVVEDTTYYLYFYLENMLGMGMQDRWDRVAEYRSKTGDNVITVMSELAADLNKKLNGYDTSHPVGPIANDFEITFPNVNVTINVADATKLFGVTPTRTTDTWTTGTDTETLTKGSGTQSGKKYTLVKKEGDDTPIKATYVFDDSATDYTISNDIKIVVKETLAGSGLDSSDDLELYIRMHTNPYAYHVTMSTGKTVNGAIEAWEDDDDYKNITGTPDTDRTYVSAATKVLAMELYFLRNRADKYDLNADFYTSILNKVNTDKSAATYTTVDVDYAFSDTQGYTYHSDKQLSVAFPVASDNSAVTNFILALRTENGNNSTGNTSAMGVRGSDAHIDL